MSIFNTNHAVKLELNQMISASHDFGSSIHNNKTKMYSTTLKHINENQILKEKNEKSLDKGGI